MCVPAPACAPACTPTPAFPPACAAAPCDPCALATGNLCNDPCAEKSDAAKGGLCSRIKRLFGGK